MIRRFLPAALALVGVVLGSTASGEAANTPAYTLTATRACLLSRADAVAGMPPARPPVPAALFVYALAHDALSTVGIGPRPRAHTQLGVWGGHGTYRGIILSFFRNVPDARASSKALAWSYGGTRTRNVVATWDQRGGPGRQLREGVLGCLRSGAPGPARPKPTRPASMATFAGAWGGHTRGLSITAGGRGREYVDDGCCTRAYELTFQILSARGTLTRAVAEYRVTSFRRHESDVAPLRVGEAGRLRLRDGIVTNTRTQVFFCSDPAWGATGACGA